MHIYLGIDGSSKYKHHLCSIFICVCFLLANLSLDEMRCLYFKLKDKVFSQLPIGGLPHSNTEELEKILKNIFGEYRTLGSKQYPK